MSHYHYIYHHLLRQSKYDKALTRIEVQLQKLGLNGQTDKLLQLSGSSEIVSRLLARNRRPDTLVLVGDDELLLEALNAAIESGHSPTIGYLPMFDESNLTKVLGLLVGERGVEALAGRLVRELDVGTVGGRCFLDSLTIANSDVVIQVDRRYTISPTPDISYIKIHNLVDLSLSRKIRRAIDPQNGQLALSFIAERSRKFLGQRQKRVDTLIQSSSLKINSLGETGAVVLVDNCTKLKTPIEVGVLSRAVRLIVGKQRSMS